MKESDDKNGKFVCLGIRKNGVRVITQTAVDRLERYLLLYETLPKERFLARVFRLNVCLGTFRPVGETTGYMKYYLYWHSRCKKFVVAYVHGYSHLPCDFCGEHKGLSKKQIRNLAKRSLSSKETAIFFN